jgi:iron-sulfur cluster assembly protein
MLTLTDNAADVVQKIVEQTVEEEQAGLRISQQADESLALAPTVTSHPGDQIVEDKGARVFLDEGAAALLEDKILDAQVEEDGAVQFAIGIQA